MVARGRTFSPVLDGEPESDIPREYDWNFYDFVQSTKMEDVSEKRENLQGVRRWE